jgi:hypothetical protein
VATDAGAATGAEVPAPAPTRTATPPTPPSVGSTPAVTATAPAAGDAGASACKPLRPPYIDPSFIAPVLLRVRDPGAELVFNDSGLPRFVPVARDASDASVAPLASAAAAARTRSQLPACVAAGDTLFCPDASGAVHEWQGESHAIVAKARPGTDIAAVGVAGHAALAYLADRVTSEGVVREAWALVDHGAPVKLSEDGSGATFVDLAPRGDGLLAMTIDARVAMTPAHARPLALEGSTLKLGADAVVFVGGSVEPHNAGALVTGKDGRAFELVAVADGASAFGMAAIRVENPPKEDEPVVWSFYPNGLDPAPLAVTQLGDTTVVARVRPRDEAPHAARDLEVGALSAAGAFEAWCVIDEAPFIKDIEVGTDAQGALWVFYRDPRGSVLERRALPPRR